jgi:hypothetical protein
MFNFSIPAVSDDLVAERRRVFTQPRLKPDMLTSAFVAKMDSREHYQADDLMKSIKARSGAGTSRRPG